MQNANVRGILLMVISMAGFAIEDLFLKYLSHDVPAAQIMIVTGFGGALVMLVAAMVTGAPIYSSKLWDRHIVIRTLADLFGSLFFIWALVLLPLTMLSSIIQVIPLAVTAGAALILKEKVGIRRWSAICTGFIGVMIIIRPTSEGIQIGAVLALLMVITLSIRDLATRQMKANVPSITLSIYAFIAFGVAGLLTLIFDAQWVHLEPRHIVWFTLAVAFATFAYFCIVVSTRIGDASVVAPFRYSRLLFALVLAMTFLGERLDTITIFGIVLVIGSGLYTFWRENKLGSKTAQ
jgi:drug/metabolite transporter (DMT)-like permease